MKRPTTKTFPPMHPCPLCKGDLVHEKTRLGYYCDSICRCTGCKTLIVNNEPATTMSPYSKLVMMYDIVETGLNIAWNKLPALAQSLLFIGLWEVIIIIATWNAITDGGIPALGFFTMSLFLGVFYIYHEARGTLRGERK